MNKFADQDCKPWIYQGAECTWGDECRFKHNPAKQNQQPAPADWDQQQPNGRGSRPRRIPKTATPLYTPGGGSNRPKAFFTSQQPTVMNPAPLMDQLAQQAMEKMLDSYQKQLDAKLDSFMGKLHSIRNSKLFKPSATVRQRPVVMPQQNLGTLFKPSATVVLDTTPTSIPLFKPSATVGKTLATLLSELFKPGATVEMDVDSDDSRQRSVMLHTMGEQHQSIVARVPWTVPWVAKAAASSTPDDDTWGDPYDPTEWGEAYDPRVEGTATLPVYHTLYTSDVQPVTRPPFRTGRYKDYSRSELRELAPTLLRMLHRKRNWTGDTPTDTTPQTKETKYKLQWCNDCNLSNSQIPKQLNKTLQANFRRRLRKSRTPNYAQHIKNKKVTAMDAHMNTHGGPKKGAHGDGASTSDHVGGPDIE